MNKFMLKIWKWIEKHPVIANPLVVTIYLVTNYLLQDGTDLFAYATWRKAATIIIVAVLSGVKNAVQKYQTKN